MKIWLSPIGDLASIEDKVSEKAAILSRAAEAGARFLVLPITDNLEACTWILGSFASPIAVVPISPTLPTFAVEKIFAQLPPGSAYFPETLPQQTQKKVTPSLKQLDEIWAVIFTSGSSGEAKGVALSGSNLQMAALAHSKHLDAKNTSWLLNLPLFHIGGFSILSRAFFLNSDFALSSTRFNAESTIAWLQSGLISGISLVPTMLFRLLAESQWTAPNLKMALLGGSGVDPALADKAIARNLPILKTYGMTEHASQIATEIEPGAGLRALPGVEINIGANNEILVRSPILSTGYFSKGQLQPLALEDGLFRTGDLGSLIEGKLTVSGRKSELINCGGVKIFPAELELVLGSTSGILDCAVNGLASEEWGEVICAIVVAGKHFSEEKACAQLAQQLDPRKLPRHWLYVEKIPRSETGKILRGELKALVRERLIANRN